MTGPSPDFGVDPDRLDDATRAMTHVASDWDRRLSVIKRLAEPAHAAAEDPDEPG